MCTYFVDTHKSIFHAATDIHLLVFYIFKGSVSQSAPVLLYVSTIQDVKGHL